MKHYTDLRLSDSAKAVAMLPRVSDGSKGERPPEAAVAKATGTDDGRAAHLSARLPHNVAESFAEPQDHLKLVGSLGSDADLRYTLDLSGVTHSRARLDTMRRDASDNAAGIGAVGAVG